MSESSGGGEPAQPPKPSGMTTKEVADFLIQNEEAIGRYIDRLARHIVKWFDDVRQHKETVARAQARTGFVIILSVFILLGAGLVLTFILVLNALLSGETFVFFIGALFGSLITFLAERIPLLYPPEEEEA